MPSDTSEHRPARPRVSAAAAGGGASLHHPPPPPQAGALPCSRCDSTNTKFCCYNNYNLYQPRHFCKSRRRYWTQGGTLRNVPVGGGSRKSASAASASASSKRPRSLAPPPSSSLSFNSSSSSVTHDPRRRARESPACPVR